MNRDLFIYLYRQEEFKPILWAIITTALTEKQRLYFIDYYIRGEKQKNIAEKYGVSQSVVSLTIGRAGDNVNKIFQIFLEAKEIENGKRNNAEV